MLVRLIVANFLSFHELTEFNMLPGDIRRLPHHVHTSGKLEVLKSAALYGANGAGKSNLIKALVALKGMVDAGEINRNLHRPFKPDPSCEKKESHFEIEILADGKSYLYGIETAFNYIKEEWLYETRPEGTDQLIFSRHTDSGGNTRIEVADKFKKRAEDRYRIGLYEKELLAGNKLLLRMLSEAKGPLSEAAKRIATWFNELEIIFPFSKTSEYLSDMIKDPKRKDFYKTALASFVTGITDFEIQSTPFDEFKGINNSEKRDTILASLDQGNDVILRAYSPSEEEVLVISEEGKPVVKSLMFNHKNAEAPFRLDEESDGTLRLFDYLPMLFDLMHSNKVYVVDEIERSIHPALMMELMKQLMQTAERKGQLIFTTHESNLLDQEVFRQDEIWFVEKNEKGATQLYPLSEFDIRNDLDISKGYLAGRFGAIPFLTALKNLKWDSDAA